MEYQVVKYERKGDLKEALKDSSLEFSLKALENQEFEMPAVCH